MRTISRNTYIVAAFITLAIFLLGMFLGMVVETKRASYMSSIAEQQKLDLGSLQLQYQYIEQLGQEKNCPAVSATFEKYASNLASSQERLEKYQQDANIDQQEFLALKQEYTQSELSFWLLAKQTKQTCSRDVASILYFYSNNENCGQCSNQAFILSYLKQVFKDKLLVFSIDASLDIEPMVSILKNTYNITNYPTLIIENKKFEGLTSKEDIVKEICKQYTSNVTECST